jgi:hypothetical protein
MCGIVGFVAPHRRAAFQAHNIFPELFFINQLRGRDACGMFGVHNSTPKHVDWIRAVGPPDQFMKEKEVHKRFISRLEGFMFVVGHNRYATIGDRDKVEAAHPHKTADITLVHNGTLHAYEGRKKYVSDSAAMAAYLQTYGDFIKAKEKFRGAFATVWHDARNNTLNFARNHERPLWWIEQNNGTGWFASEPDMAIMAIERNRQKISAVKEFKVDNWSRLDLETGKIEEIVLPFVKGSRRTTGILPSPQATESNTLALTAVNTDGITEGDDPDRARAFETIVHGANEIRDFGQMIFEYGKEEVPPPKIIDAEMINFTPRQSRMPQVGRQRNRLADLGPNDQRRVLEDWSGFKAGDTIMYFPLEFRATADWKIALAGPMMTWGEDSVEFQSGVEIRGRIDERVFKEQKLEATEGGIIKSVFRIQEMNVPHEAEITAIHEDVTRKRIVVWVKDSYPQDWFSTDAYCSLKDIEDAWRTPYPPMTGTASAPEVADIAKKLQQSRYWFLANTVLDMTMKPARVTIRPNSEMAKRIQGTEGIAAMMTRIFGGHRGTVGGSNVPNAKNSATPTKPECGLLLGKK